MSNRSVAVEFIPARQTPSMMRLFLSLLVAVATLLTVSLSAQPVRAQTTTDSGHDTFFFPVYNEATGEDILVEGEYHYVIKTRYNKKTDTTTFDFQVNAHGTGVGVDSGTQYVFNDTYRDSTVVPGSGGFTETLLDRIRLISPGSAPNVFITARGLFVVDANGIIVTDEFTLDTVTRG